MQGEPTKQAILREPSPDTFAGTAQDWTSTPQAADGREATGGARRRRRADWLIRRLLPLLADLSIFACSPFIAIYVRENFETSPERLANLAVYAALLTGSAAAVLLASGLNRGVWRFTSTVEVPRILGVVTISLLLGLAATFVINRLDGVSRSLPVLQWFGIVAGMLAMRSLARFRMLSRRRRTAPRDQQVAAGVRTVLVLGVNEVASLYLKSVAEYGTRKVNVAGLLARRERHKGRLVQLQKVLGTYDDVDAVLKMLEVHGVFVDRLIVTEPFPSLDSGVQRALRALEASGRVKLDMIVESLGLIAPEVEGACAPEIARSAAPAPTAAVRSVSLGQPQPLRNPLGWYGPVKRGFDVILSLAVLAVALPLMLIVACVVACDLGSPMIFWQQRTGRNMRLFRLYKFRTMREAFNGRGERLTDDSRVSRFGEFLRRSRLDELPQLCSILNGDMSLIGPRPLLPLDLPEAGHIRFQVRPGLTGWAQINGGRDVTTEERAALDAWYVRNASLLLDIRIALGTIRMLVCGDRRNEPAIADALTEMSRCKPSVPASQCSPIVVDGLRTV